MDALAHLFALLTRLAWSLGRLLGWAAVWLVGHGFATGQWLAGWIDAHLVVRR